MKQDFLLMLRVTADKWKVDGDERERVMECQWRFDEMV